MLVSLFAAASAQTPILDDAAVVADATWPNGFGAPSVVWDGARFRMFAETEVAPPAGCTEAWAVVRASSADGVNFGSFVQVQGPGPATPCGARRPAAVWTDTGTWAVAWEAVGFQVPRLGVTHTVTGVRRARLLNGADGLTEPALSRHDGVWTLVAVDPTQGLVKATSTDLRNFTVEPGPLVATGATPWSADGIENPSLSCIDDAGWPFTLAFGGHRGGDTAWTTGVIRDTDAVYVDAAIDTWSTPDAWVSFDVVDDGANLGVWFETVDPVTSLPVIGVGGAVPVGANVPGRDCTP